jgi:maleylacetoacetate isomerase/maleylpyruvate isomerase
VLQYLGREFGADQRQKDDWYRHWVREGLLAVERLLASNAATGEFCHGDAPTLADCCLVPQVFNARRFDCSLEEMPTVVRIADACEKIAAFQEAAPGNQADAE